MDWKTVGEIEMIGKKLKEWHKKQKPVIKEIVKLERKHGMELVRAAVSRHYAKVREEQKRVHAIRRMERELEELKKQKL